MHITASVFINDDESGLHQDYEVWLEKLAPEKPMANTSTTGMRIMLMRTSSVPSWAEKLSVSLPMADWTSAHGSRSSIMSWMEKEIREY